MKKILDALQVVVIEGDAAMLRLYEEHFFRAGFPIESHGFRNAAEAMRHMIRIPPDLVIVDMQLPEIDGYKLVENISGLFSLLGVDVIAASGADEAALRANGDLPEGVTVIPKPVPFGLLLQRMRMMHAFKVGLSRRH